MTSPSLRDTGRRRGTADALVASPFAGSSSYSRRVRASSVLPATTGSSTPSNAGRECLRIPDQFGVRRRPALRAETGEKEA